MKRHIAGVVVVLGIVAGAGIGSASAGGRPLVADLSADNEVPAAGTGASGVAQLTLNQGQGEICVEIDAEGFAGSVVAGHIHVGVAGVNGPVVVNLGVNSADYDACLDGIDEELIKAIRQEPSSFYVNVHTTAFPGGEIRGQLSK